MYTCRTVELHKDISRAGPHSDLVECNAREQHRVFREIVAEDVKYLVDKFPEVASLNIIVRCYHSLDEFVNALPNEALRGLTLRRLPDAIQQVDKVIGDIRRSLIQE